MTSTHVGTSTDIEGQKQAEEWAPKSQENWRVLAETESQLVWTARPDGHLDYFDPRVCDYLGVSPENILGSEWRQFVHPDDYECLQALRRHSLETGNPYEIAYRLKDGQTRAYRWFLVRTMPVRDETGQIVKWFGTGTDIEDQKRAEQQIKASEENWRVLAETVPQFVWETSPDGLVEYWNQRWYDYTSSSPAQALGHRWSQFLHPDDYQRTLTIWHHACASGEAYEIEYRLKNGQTGAYRWFLTRGVPVRDETGQIAKWFGTGTDIEDQKRIEEALRQSQERAGVLMNSSMLGISVIEGELIVDANDTFLRMTGYTREDLRAGRMNWIHMTPPEYLACTQQAHQELATQQSVTYEKEYVCQDGSRLPVLVCGVVLKQHPLQAIGFVLDNSARKELEQRKDDFISMASHELKTPLTSLKLQTQLLRKKLGRHDLPNVEVVCARMETQLNVITRLVDELLDLSRIQAGKLEYAHDLVDLDEMLEEVVEVIQGTQTTHTVVVHAAASPTFVVGDRDRLAQVFLNVLSNAIKYAPDAPLIEVVLNTEASAVTISVRDQGIGIPREVQGKIFERFYRAVALQQRAFPGLGMGLYIVAEIVEHHGGTIRVESERGKGSTFHLTFPLAASREEVSRRREEE